MFWFFFSVKTLLALILLLALPKPPPEIDFWAFNKSAVVFGTTNLMTSLMSILDSIWVLKVGLSSIIIQND